MDFAEPDRVEDQPITEHTVVALTAKGRALMTELLEILTACVGTSVSGAEVGDALRSMRERDGIAFDLSNEEHRQMLLERLAELKGLANP